MRFDGKQAICESLDVDRYGRIVARCHVAGQDVAARLVADGLAFAYRTYSRDYVPHEQRAAGAGRGLHRSTVQPPAEYRAAARTAPVPSPKSTCAIKGNISANGTRIYHMAHQRHYTRTVISAAKGEQWFCSEAQARAAGWRKARQ